MTLHIPEPLRQLARAARRNGWTVTVARSGHLRWEAPDGTVVRTASTPGSAAAGRTARARLARAGLSARKPGASRQETADDQ